jgi:hypothetical protein
MGGAVPPLPQYDFMAWCSGEAQEYITLLYFTLLHRQWCPVTLYGCESWFLSRRREHGLNVFKNRVLRRTFGPKGDEVAGGWRRLYNEELHNFYASQNVTGVVSQGG